MSSLLSKSSHSKNIPSPQSSMSKLQRKVNNLSNQDLNLQDLTNTYNLKKKLQTSCFSTPSNIEQQLKKLCEKIQNGFSNMIQNMDQSMKEAVQQNLNIDMEKNKFSDPLTILENIFCLHDFQKFWMEEQIQNALDDASNQYEQYMQKLEAEIRDHISIEQQLQLMAQSSQSKLEDKEKEIQQIQSQFQKELQKITSNNDIDKVNELKSKILIQQKEIEQLKNQLNETYINKTQNQDTSQCQTNRLSEIPTYRLKNDSSRIHNDSRIQNDSRYHNDSRTQLSKDQKEQDDQIKLKQLQEKQQKIMMLKKQIQQFDLQFEKQEQIKEKENRFSCEINKKSNRSSSSIDSAKNKSEIPNKKEILKKEIYTTVQMMGSPKLKFDGFRSSSVDQSKIQKQKQTIPNKQSYISSMLR